MQDLESLVAVELDSGSVFDQILQVGVRYEQEHVRVDERAAMVVVGQHELALPPVNSIGVLVVDRADEALGVGLRDLAVVVLAVHGGGKVPLDGCASVAQVFLGEADLEGADEPLVVGRVARVGPADEDAGVVRGEARRGGQHEGVLVDLGVDEAEKVEELARVAPGDDLVEDLRRAVVELRGSSC